MCSHGRVDRAKYKLVNMMIKHKYRNKKCRVCKTEFKAFSSTTVVCSIRCAIEHNEKNKQRLEKRRKAIERKKTREAWLALQPKSYWLKEAQKWFNKFIRLRDENKDCISSGGARGCSRQRHAGHYRSVGSSPHLRFDERNCHGQCAYCNNHLSANLIQYRINLIERIGVEEVEQLESDNDPKHYTIDDVKQIIEKYKAKCKEME